MLHRALAKPSGFKQTSNVKREGGPSMTASSSPTSVSLFSYQAMEVIQCRMCHLQFPGENCSRGRGICMATTDEACTVGRMFTSKLWVEERKM